MFPNATHSEDPESTVLLPFAGVSETIDSIPLDCSNHNIPIALKIAKEPYDGSRPFPCTILTGKQSSDLGHPSGERAFSIREFASLQGIPLEHRFPLGMSDTQIPKQIGNAFPALIAEILFRSIKRQLESRDNLENTKRSRR